MSSMSTINAAAPSDEELFKLYEEVRRGYASNTHLTAVERRANDVNDIIDEYTADDNSQPPGYERSPGMPQLPAEKAERPFSIPQSPRVGRPLPKPPMVASGSSNRIGSSDMQAYASSSTSGSSTPTPLNGTIPLPGDSNRPGTSGSNGATRRLPLAPDVVGLPMRPSSSASGDSNRLSNNSSYGYNNGSKHPYTPGTALNGNTLQAPQWTQGSSSTSNLSNGHSALLGRSGSTRPKGALAAAVPGQSFSINDPPASPSASTSSADFYATSPPSDVLPDYIGSSDSSAQVYRPVDPALKHYAPTHLSQAALPGRAGPSAGPSSGPSSGPSYSNDYESYARNAIDDAHPSSSPSLLSPGESSLGRSASNGSATSSYQSNNLDRNTSTTTTTSMFTNGKSVATTVDRGGSISSFASATSTESYPARPSYESYRQTSSTSDDLPRVGSASGSSRMDKYKQRHQQIRVMDDIKRQLALHETYESEEEDLDEYEEEDRFVNLSLLSHIAVRLRDKVPRGTHVKGGIPYHRAFTGKDIVSTIQAQIQRELQNNMQISSGDRRPALSIARSLQSQLFFYEVEWGGRVLQDSVEDVYAFLDDQEGGADSRHLQEELPTGVFTPLTKCYTAGCIDGMAPCYAFSCPRRQTQVSRDLSLVSIPDTSREPKAKDWSELIDKSTLRSLPESEVNRQNIIHKAISKEDMYVQDIALVERIFMKPLRAANPPVIPPEDIDSFMDDVFHNILEIRDVNRRLVEVMEVRQREQYPIIQKIGDVFLTAATDFRVVYPNYVGNLPVAEKRLKDELESNAEFRRFVEQLSRAPELRRIDLKSFLNRPSEHLQKYPDLLEAIFNETAEGNPDADFLLEAIQAIRKLQSVSQLRTFQAAMGKGPTGRLEWHELVSEEVRSTMTKQEQKRQAVIFELIKGEMMYVKDLESMGTMYVQPLQSADPPLIPHERLSSFLHDTYHNYMELLILHRNLLERLHEVQRDEHPTIHSVTAPLLDAALNWHDAYMEYVPNYPISHYRIDVEMANNPEFKSFADQTTRNPDSRRLDMKNFVHRPVARLARYDLLLSGILKETPPNHEDRESIPQVQEVLKSLLKETETGVTTAKQRVEIWQYNENLVFKPGEAVDMDLLDENRQLIHTGKLLRQPDTGFEWNGWTELFVLLFDNYLVLTKPKEKDGITKYHVNRRPIPLDLLTLVNFKDPPQQRSKGILGFSRGGGGGGGAANGRREDDQPINGGTNSPEAVADARAVYPCTIHHNGRLGGMWTIYAETAVARSEWKQKLDEAIVIRKVVTDANKVFEIETLSSDTFLVPSIHATQAGSAWNDENVFTGKVTCSVPFSTPDGRGLVAIGCAEGVWIGLRHDPRSMRRVLHLKMVTQCAMLEDFGIFLVLADKALFAYHIEALVPSSPPNANASRTPQKLNGNKDVQFFTVGTLGGRTLVIYMKKKGLDSVFRVLEPVIGKINEKAKATGGLSRFGFGSQRSEWFRIFRDFFLPSESYDLIFLKAKIAILCSKGFEIMDLTDFKSVTIPQREDPRLAALTKRCESCKPMGMFRSSENEFLLCYDEFGLYVDRYGDPSRTIGTIEWEGTAERVAWHPPYVLLFDSRFIEIRHVETGRLCQIIKGEDIRCLWDGRGSNVPPVGTPGPDGWIEGGPQDARIHAVMTAESTGQKSSRAVAQHVFQLVPTIPLYLPGSLSSPSNSTYFPQTSSPPRSPPLTPRQSWR